MVSKPFTSFFIIALLLIVGFQCKRQADIPGYETIEGYWEGEFMPGNNLTLVLDFHRKVSGKDHGRVLLFEGEQQIQDDPLKNIVLDGKQISFYIEAKQTPFKGELIIDSLQIRGNFYFPDGSVHPLIVKKVDSPVYNQYYDQFVGNLDNEKILNRTFTTKQLQEDLNYARERLEQYHPLLYQYQTKQEWNHSFEDVMLSLNSQMTEDVFFRQLAPLIASVRCSHTAIRTSEKFYESLNEQYSLIPLDIFILGNKAWVIHNFVGQSQIEPGTQILAINGLAVSEILRILYASLPADGNNTSYKKYQIINDFPRIYSQYIGYSKSYVIDGLSPEGLEVRDELPAITDWQLEEAMNMAYPKRASYFSHPYRFELLSMTHSALITVKGFWASNEVAYATFLEGVFQTLRQEKVRSLIIDIRGNNGGLPVFAAQMLSYISKDEFTYFRLPAERAENDPLFKPWKPRPNSFKGDIYILMNGGCISTAGHFLSLVQYHKLATLIGEEAGGSFTCNDNSIRLRLPNTGIRMNIARTIFQTAVTGFRMGDPIVPDYIVQPTIDDLIYGMDAEKMYALNMIKNKMRGD